jgi:nicotinamide riboside kinase
MTSARIVITGPESTGKSTLAFQLAQHFNGVCVGEFARDYIQDLKRPYNYDDVEIIARRQVHDFKNTEILDSKLIFIDTYLIITKVWFEVVYKSYPTWIEDEIRNSKIDLFLLCAPDLPWEKDEVRENGGEMRNWLFEEYKKNIIKYNFAYRIVNGFGESRIINAISLVEAYLGVRT